MAQPCFDNAVAQAIHKYISILLLAFIGILAWWGSNIDSRVNIIGQEQAKRTQAVEQVKQLNSDLIQLRVQFSSLEAINIRLSAQESMLKRIETRLDALINRRAGFKEIE